MPNYIDCTPDLQDQDLCARLLFWPCQSGVALTNALFNCDITGACKVCFCCPCRTFCGWFPTEAEKSTFDPNSEPHEIPYDRVFEMEQKKRSILNNAQVN